jgi:hypothetical protein
MLNIPDARHFSEAERLARRSDADFRAADAASDPAEKQARLDDAQRAAAQSALAAAYTYLQRAVGVIAFALPILLVGLNYFFFEADVKGSISEYYFTPVGTVFVGSLCALAVFFLSYNYRPLPNFRWDNWLSTAATVCALGVAFFPTTEDADTATAGEASIGVVHLIFAGALFALMAFFSLVLFRRSDGGTLGPRKQRRNALYLVCGIVIATAIVGVPVSNLFSWHLLLVLESIAVFAFSLSWLVKGGLFPFLNDPAPVPARPVSPPDVRAMPSLQPGG